MSTAAKCANRASRARSLVEPCHAVAWRYALAPGGKSALLPATTDRIPDERAILFARVLDGKGGEREIGWEELTQRQPAHDEEVLWAHLRRGCPAVRAWLIDGMQVPESTADMLTSDVHRNPGDAAAAVPAVEVALTYQRIRPGRIARPSAPQTATGRTCQMPRWSTLSIGHDRP